MTSLKDAIQVTQMHFFTSQFSGVKRSSKLNLWRTSYKVCKKVLRLKRETLLLQAMAPMENYPRLRAEATRRRTRTRAQESQKRCWTTQINSQWNHLLKDVWSSVGSHETAREWTEVRKLFLCPRHHFWLAFDASRRKAVDNKSNLVSKHFTILKKSTALVTQLWTK